MQQMSCLGSRFVEHLARIKLTNLDRGTHLGQQPEDQTISGVCLQHVQPLKYTKLGFVTQWCSHRSFKPDMDIFSVLRETQFEHGHSTEDISTQEELTRKNGAKTKDSTAISLIRMSAQPKQNKLKDRHTEGTHTQTRMQLLQLISYPPVAM